MSTVFVVNDSGHDFSPAKKFGTIEILTHGSVNVFATDKLVRDLCLKLAKSRPDDYMLVTGSSLASSIVFHYLMVTHGHVNALIHSFRNKDYELRTIRRSQFKMGAKK